jgi:hypothetical protein
MYTPLRIELGRLLLLLLLLPVTIRPGQSQPVCCRLTWKSLMYTPLRNELGHWYCYKQVAGYIPAGGATNQRCLLLL